MKKLLKRNPVSGAETWFHHDGEKIFIERKQDLSWVNDIRQRMRNDFEGYKDKGDNHFHHVAHFTAVEMDHILNTHGIDVLNEEHADRVWKLLNDSDYRNLRTTRGWV